MKSSPRTLAVRSRARAAHDPLRQVLGLGRRASPGILIGLAIAFVVHGAAAARAALIPLDLIHWSQGIEAMIHEKLWATYDIDLVKPPEEKPPEPQPEPPPEEKEPTPPPAPVAKAPAPEKEPAPPPPAPAAAQAGQVLASDEPLDFTGDGFTQGNAATYAGGVTHALGTSTTAVRAVGARPNGVPGGTGTAPPPPPRPAEDKSRGAGLRGASDWKCPWPSEADAEQIDDAYVTVQVSVGPDGHARQVTIVNDPGHGFAREARICAMRETYTTALDVVGTAIAGQTKPFRIHFER